MLPRERFAWVWLTALVVVFSIYFAAISIMQPSPTVPGPLQLVMLSMATGVLAIAALGNHLVGRLPGQRRNVPLPDERDRLIEARSSAAAYYVLMAGMLLVGCVMPFNKSGWDIVHGALLAIAVAEIVHYGMIVFGYRRGWRV